LLDWAVNQGLLTVSPLRTRRRRTSPDRFPFLFDATKPVGSWTPQPPCPTTRGRRNAARPITPYSRWPTALG
jgi:hypothetical protein